MIGRGWEMRPDFIIFVGVPVWRRVLAGDLAPVDTGKRVGNIPFAPGGVTRNLGVSGSGRGVVLMRNSFPSQIAGRMCAAIDGREKVEHFQRLLQEYNEWLMDRQRQQEFLRECYR